MKRSARSTRFPVALHIMCMLALVETVDETTYLSSGWMAQSIRKNEAMIRQILGMLVRAGLVKSHAGSKGGSRLARDAADISLLDIYKSVETQEIFSVHEGAKECLVAHFVEDYLGGFFGDAEAQFERDLADTKLSTLLSDLHQQVVTANFVPPPLRGAPLFADSGSE